MAYTKEFLIKRLNDHYVRYGKVPRYNDMIRNSDFPGARTYEKRFGTWNNALKAVGLDFESMLRKGKTKIECSHHKGRLFEILTNKSFLKGGAIDLSGQNFTNSPFDGICPRGFNYDCKSSHIRIDKRFKTKSWYFSIDNKDIGKIQFLFLGGFNEDYTKLLHVWMIPIQIACYEGTLHIKHGISISASEGGLLKWKQYEVTDSCLDLDKLLGKLMETKM